MYLCVRRKFEPHKFYLVNEKFMKMTISQNINELSVASSVHGKFRWFKTIKFLVFASDSSELPVEAPVHVRAKVLSSSTVWLQWQDPSLGGDQTLSDNRYYNVVYQVHPHPISLNNTNFRVYIIIFLMFF